MMQHLSARRVITRQVNLSPHGAAFMRQCIGSALLEKMASDNDTFLALKQCWVIIN